MDTGPLPRIPGDPVETALAGLLLDMRGRGSPDLHLNVRCATVQPWVCYLTKLSLSTLFLALSKGIR